MVATQSAAQRSSYLAQLLGAGQCVLGCSCTLTLFLCCSHHQGDMLVHLLEQPELHGTPSGLAAHRLQGLLDTALRSSSVAASPHVDVVGEGVLGGVMDKRSILQLVTAATCSLEGVSNQVPRHLLELVYTCWRGFAQVLCLR